MAMFKNPRLGTFKVFNICHRPKINYLILFPTKLEMAFQSVLHVVVAKLLIKFLVIF